MGKPRLILKSCPICKEQVPPACKYCICGWHFMAHKPELIDLTRNRTPSPEGVRRTERKRRGKPKYYDPLEYEKPLKRKKRTSNRLVTPPQKQSTSLISHSPPPAHRMHLKTNNSKKKKKPEEETVEEELEEIVLSDETLCKFALILEEINRKICASSWRAPD